MSYSIFVKDGTAQGVAKQRLIETIAGPEKSVINDPYADKFVIGSGVIKLMGHRLNVWLTSKLAPGFHEHLISRTRFIDDLIEKSAKEGVQQYVILGAGYDSRANRLNLPPSLKIFEVDQPEVSDIKLSKLPKDLPNLENITYVNVDFSYQSLSEQLLTAGFDQTKSTIFTLEGVSQYITKEAVSSTIQELSLITKDARSIFFMSYVDELLKKDPAACFGKGYPNPTKKANLIQTLSAKVGEPWISFYRDEEVESILAENGYAIKENVTLEDLNSLYFSPVGRVLPENQIFKLEHFIVAESLL
jgi:methyltransferase (TIGR00027 family)